MPTQGLAELAAAHGVALSYLDSADRTVQVDPDVVVDILAHLEVDAGNPTAIRAELARVGRHRRPDRLPPTIVLRAGQRRALTGAGELADEEGNRRAVRGELPADLPLGWYELELGGQRSAVVVTPRTLPPVPATWGWMVALYALYSAGSWGVGDFADLAALLRWSGGRLGAGAVLLNPLHATRLSPTVEPSPYSPSSRRFLNPLYLRIEDTAEFSRADPRIRERVAALRVPVGNRIDYDATWRTKQQALQLLHPLAEPSVVDTALQDDALLDFATYSALAERHGPAWRDWPVGLRRPDGPAVAAARAELADRVAFHAWLQLLCRRQLDDARAASAGMPVGVIGDLAVGVDGDGADAWALQDVLATEVTIGAPPDDYNQRGQDWGLPPWRPDSLAAAGYRPYRALVRSLLAHADGVRVDHVAGLWRLWWIPPGNDPRRGSYVRYDADALLGILALEAHRAGAVVVGEDLGTVEPEVTEQMHGRGVLGCAVLWFQRDGQTDELLPAARWPAAALASISTHDLPTAPGFLSGEHVRARAELHLLDDPAAEQARAVAERAELVGLLVREGLLADPDAPAAEIVAAMHALLGRTPCRLRLAALTDVLGETRQPNLPGTIAQYPNWRLPLPRPLEEIESDPAVARLAACLARRTP